MQVMAYLTAAGLFVLTAWAEIFGCYTVYAWLKTSGSVWWLGPGAVSLALFAWLLTLHPSGAAGRTYAAYGGVYIAMAVLWMWLVEHKRPDRWDIIGSLVCCVGMAIIMFAPRTH
jgi:small multidrug resistance family-3 protein